MKTKRVWLFRLFLCSLTFLQTAPLTSAGGDRFSLQLLISETLTTLNDPQLSVTVSCVSWTNSSRLTGRFSPTRTGFRTLPGLSSWIVLEKKKTCKKKSILNSWAPLKSCSDKKINREHDDIISLQQMECLRAADINWRHTETENMK